MRKLGLIVCLLAACNGEPERENTVPSVPAPPGLERVEIDAFSLSWAPSEDDTTAQSAIRYDVGIVSTDVCIVVSPDFELTGETELRTRMAGDYPQTPFVGFTVRAIDEEDRSAGYGPCIWGLREPVRLPNALAARRPRLRPAPALGPSTACRADGRDGVWCEAEDELAHFRGVRWQSFPLPQPFETVGWVPIDDYNALVRSDQVQLQLSRANGTSASVISSGSQHFDPDVGAIGTGRLRAYLGVRGFAAELETRHIDIAGPPQPALSLPGTCDELIQIGRQREMAFALCRAGQERQLFVGVPERRAFTWRTAPIPIEGDRIDGLLGQFDDGLVVVSSPDGAVAIFWDNTEVRRQELELPPGQGRPIVALAGTPDAPFLIAGRHFRYRAWDGQTWTDLETTPDDRVVWLDVTFPRESHLVGTPLGVYAISPERTVRLSPGLAELLHVHPGPTLARRGRDARTYLLRGPELREVTSSRDGLAWFSHPWRGPPLEPHDVAITASGGIWVSGLTRNPGEPPSMARPIVRKLGSEQDVDRTPPMPITGRFAVPSLAADGRGRLFAYLLGHVAVLDTDADDWRILDPVPGQLHRMIGLDNGALVALTTAEGPRLIHCQSEICTEVPVGEAARRPFGALIPRGSGFCVGVQSRALWCREGTEDTWVEVQVRESLASEFGLGPDDVWDIVGAAELDPGVWLMALATEDSGFLVAVDDEREVTRLLARGLHWGEGDVLLPPDAIARELGRIVGIELEGPVDVRYGDSRVSVPGTLYR